MEGMVDRTFYFEIEKVTPVLVVVRSPLRSRRSMTRPPPCESAATIFPSIVMSSCFREGNSFRVVKHLIPFLQSTILLGARSVLCQPGVG